MTRSNYVNKNRITFEHRNYVGLNGTNKQNSVTNARENTYRQHSSHTDTPKSLGRMARFKIMPLLNWLPRAAAP